ncbi:nitrite reductase small subunit NirD [Vibrio sp. ZSDZ34]|jgi:nitrite reductase (NADH) small subunit|uniref:Nitrite reductase small subunit NirD n=1 Tax=Vibrio gelatinilyticus TaxID=2893468 RepID=A0A9X1WBJ5_9VIBR|nr:nitrite reductase small subunit NirD [Vibrio gelatinilyticus]MCJ2377209.1 nitrite reductase small subunit NirD [Vibrio gelatinilyticus]
MWNKICDVTDLTPYQGRGALVGDTQLALFYLPETEQAVYAIDNWDPIGGAFVLSRGIVGDIDGRDCVASPLYKQHFDLTSGECIEAPEVAVKTWQVEIRGEEVWVMSA